MVASDSQRTRGIGWSAASESHWQSQLRAVRAVACVTRHCHHCFAANRDQRKRRRKRTSSPCADALAGRNDGHFPGRTLRRIFWSGYRHLDDRRSDLHFAGRDSTCRCAQEFLERLDARSGGACSRAWSERELEVWRADGYWRFGWWLHRGDSVASRKPHCYSLDRHRDWTCGVRALLLEVVRPAYHAHRRRVGAISTRSLYSKISMGLGTS